MRTVCDSDQNFPAKKVAVSSHPATDTDLADLVQRMGRGDREAAATFVIRYGEFIRRRVRGKLEASVRRLFDSQDIMSTFGRRLDSYVLGGNFAPRSEDEFWSLVFLVANSSVVDKTRIVEALNAKEGEDSDFAAWMQDRLRDAEKPGSAQSSDAKYELALDELLRPLKSEQDRTIATLWAMGVPHAQIAEQVGLSHDVVRQRWHRIREFLRSSLKEP